LTKFIKKIFPLLWYSVTICRNLNGLNVRNKVNGPLQKPCGEKNRSTTSRDLNVSL